MTLEEAIKMLRESGAPSPEEDARLLFSEIAGVPRHELVLKSTRCDNPELVEAIKKRVSGIPVQYVIGEVEFYRERYEVSPDCLIPREDTEILVDYAVKRIPDGESFIDICTGSGCIAISTLKNTKQTRALAIDISEGALRIAKKNATKNGVCDRLELRQANALDFVPEAPVFAILSNPPYVTISAYATLAREIGFEPKIAFVGGDDGLDFYKKIIPNCKSAIKENGFIALEIGYDQRDAILELAQINGMHAEVFKDLSGNDRLAVLSKP